ncbi:hypothetical protein NHX12_007072, partial [Muraenolepis orangiensis]
MEAPPPRVKTEKIWSNEIPQRAEPAEPDQSLVTNCSQEMESLRLHLQALQRQLQQVNSSTLHLEHNLTTLSLLPGASVAQWEVLDFQEPRGPMERRELLGRWVLLDSQDPGHRTGNRAPRETLGRGGPSEPQAHQVYKVFQELLSREKLENQDLLDQEEPKVSKEIKEAQ